MSSELRTKVETELTMMRRLLDAYPDLFADAAAGDPSRRDVAALASVVHSFYNGAEKVLKAVSDALDGRTLGPETWHTQLLDNMTQSTDRRGPVLSEPLAERLGDYMEFRHMFRHAYTLELQWRKMDHLVAGIEETFRDFEREIRAFLDTVDAGPELPPQ